jgi:hypothetical protein
MRQRILAMVGSVLGLFATSGIVAQSSSEATLVKVARLLDPCT